MQIDFVSPEDQINPENDNVDILVRLDDGRVYSLLVATPNNIYWCMDNESNDYYFGVPPVFVRRLTRGAVEAAVALLIKHPEWLNVYGSLQTP
ncbi:MAG TPA: hypothetical protein VMH05_15760 [Bryobacteraceae bacterium]|nr:hypothetical protein [Bryobacteraceae bacterium]